MPISDPNDAEVRDVIDATDDEDPPITLNPGGNPSDKFHWAYATMDGSIFKDGDSEHAYTVLSGAAHCRCGWSSYHYALASDADAEYLLHRAAAYNRGLARGMVTVETYTALTGIDLSGEGGGN